MVGFRKMWLWGGLGVVLPLCLLGRPACADDQGQLLQDGDHIVFYGDSITDGQWYPTLIATWFATRHPNWRTTFSNRGVSGDNSGSQARFERDVIAQQPDVVVYNMGFNDGGYGVLNAKRLQRFLANVEASWQKLHEMVPNASLVLVSPIPSEQQVSRDTRWITWDGYPYTMLLFGQEEERLARRLGVPFVDLGMLYGQTLGLGHVMAGDGFALSRDGVHPQESGQAVIAAHLLAEMGGAGPLAFVELDAVGKRLVREQGCKVRGVEVNEQGPVTFARTCEALPFPLPPTAMPFRFLLRFDERFNRDRIVLRGLSAPAYALKIDGHEIARFSSADLAAGVNMGSWATTPMYAQAADVMGKVRACDLAEMAYWNRWIRTDKADGAGEAMPGATAEEVKAMMDDRNRIAECQVAVYAANRPVEHHYEFIPLADPVPDHPAAVGDPFNQAWLKVAATPVRVNWNALQSMDQEITVDLANPGSQPRHFTVTWHNTNHALQIEPATASGTLEAGGKTALTFTLPGGPVAFPAPEYEVRWQWHPDWPYPLSVRRSLEYLPVLSINRSRTEVVVDGVLDDWEDATHFDLDQAWQVVPAVTGKRQLWAGPDDLSARIFLKWDDNGLFLAAKVQDSDHLQEQHGSRMLWSQDMLHIAFGTAAKGQPAGRYEFGFAVRANDDVEMAVFRSTAKAENRPPMAFSGRLSDNDRECVYETFIPWEELEPFTPEEGREFRFSLSVNDADRRPGKGFSYIQWCYGINYGKNPRDFGHIILGPVTPSR